MISAKTVTKNSLYTLSSSITQKLLTLAYFIVVARVFGPEDQGKYSAAIAFATLFGVLIDMGLSAALTRETARDATRAKEYLGQMVLARIVFGAAVYALIVGSAALLGYSHELQYMIQIAGIATFIDTLTTSCWFMMRGFRNLSYESVGSTAAVVAMIMGGSVVLIMGLKVSALMFAVLFGSLVNLSFALFTVFVRARITLHLKPNWTMLRMLALIALPFAGAAIFSRIITFSDVTILAKLAGEQAVGWYAAGNKLILALNVIPAAVAASLYPALSSYSVSSPERLGTLTARALFFLLLIAVPIGVGIVATAPAIVALFYGDAYLPTISILHVLGIAAIFGFLSFPLGSLLAAANRQKTNTLVFGIAAGINIGGNMILISRYGALGAAITAALTMAALTLLSAWFVRRMLAAHAWELATRAVRIIVSALVMGGIVWAMTVRDAGFGAILFVGVCVYAACIVFTRTVTGKEFSELRASLKV